jgi:hypothetical protein
MKRLWLLHERYHKKHIATRNDNFSLELYGRSKSMFFRCVDGRNSGENVTYFSVVGDIYYLEACGRRCLSPQIHLGVSPAI